MIDYHFEWEGDENPNDPSGVARFCVGSESVSLYMNSFEQACKLHRLFKKACDQTRQHLVDRVNTGINDLLENYRHD